MTAPSRDRLPLLAGLVWALEATEPACDFTRGLSQSPDPRPTLREPDPGPQPLEPCRLGSSFLPSSGWPLKPQA